MFTDNDQIELVKEDNGTYILSLKEKYDGYFTSQKYGNILRGIINTLAAKQAGVSDESTNNPDKQGSDDGGNKFYTSWMRVTGTNETEPQTLGANQIRVVLYGDQEVPSQKNFAPCELMTIARWGCYLNPNESGISDAEKRSRARRQQMFYISSNDGRLVKLSHVNTPILRETNYGTSLGIVPDFINNWSIASRLIEGRDYLYAQGVIVGDFIKVNIKGDPLVEYVDCGDWVDGSTGTPTVGHGIYLCNEKNEASMQYETHEVRHNGGRWRCLQSQPVVSGGVSTYYEPTWNSSYWEFVDAYDQLRIEIVSSMGEVFNDGSVATTLTPTLKCGNVDITSETQTSDWKWERRTESGSTSADTAWNSQHIGVRVLNVTTQDMPAAWSETNKAIFTASVTIRTSSGRSITVEND